MSMIEGFTMVLVREEQGWIHLLFRHQERERSFHNFSPRAATQLVPVMLFDCRGNFVL